MSARTAAARGVFEPMTMQSFRMPRSVTVGCSLLLSVGFMAANQGVCVAIACLLTPWLPVGACDAE